MGKERDKGLGGVAGGDWQERARCCEAPQDVILGRDRDGEFQGRDRKERRAGRGLAAKPQGSIWEGERRGRGGAFWLGVGGVID